MSDNDFAEKVLPHPCSDPVDAPDPWRVIGPIYSDDLTAIRSGAVEVHLGKIVPRELNLPPFRWAIGKSADPSTRQAPHLEVDLLIDAPAAPPIKRNTHPAREVVDSGNKEPRQQPRGALTDLEIAQEFDWGARLSDDGVAEELGCGLSLEPSKQLSRGARMPDDSIP